MNIKRALHRIITELDDNLPDGITKDNLFDCIDDIKASLILGEKLGKMYYILKDKIYTSSGTGISADIDRLEVEYLGSMTKNDLINDIIEEVYKLNIHPRVDKVDVVNMLVKLRDEEEDA